MNLSAEVHFAKAVWSSFVCRSYDLCQIVIVLVTDTKARAPGVEMVCLRQLSAFLESVRAVMNDED